MVQSICMTAGRLIRLPHGLQPSRENTPLVGSARSSAARTGHSAQMPEADSLPQQAAEGRGATGPLSAPPESPCPTASADTRRASEKVTIRSPLPNRLSSAERLRKEFILPKAAAWFVLKVGSMAKKSPWKHCKKSYKTYYTESTLADGRQ